MHLVAVDYYDDGRVVESYRETRYVSANGNWRSLKSFPGGFIEETVGIPRKGVFSVDQKARRLRFRASYPESSLKMPRPIGRGRGKHLNAAGYDAYITRIKHQGSTIFVARAPALNGDVTHIMTRNSGFTRVVEPISVSLGAPPGASPVYENYPIQYPNQ